MSNRVRLSSLALALVLTACGNDDVSPPAPEPDLLVSGRLLDDLGQPLSGGRVEAWLVGIPSASGLAAWVVPTCDTAEAPSDTAPDDEAVTGTDGAFALSLVGLDGPLCLVVGVREAGAPADARVLLPPRLVSPAAATPVTVALGDVAIGQLDQARE